MYIPLGGSKVSKLLSIRNIFIIFIVSGFWHGANWTFIVWGLIHATLYIPLFLKGKNRRYTTSVIAADKWFPTVNELCQMIFTFFSTMIAWVFFRSESITNAFKYLEIMVTKFSTQNLIENDSLYVLFLIICDWIMRKDERKVLVINLNKPLRYTIYSILILLILYKSNPNSHFIYFQF